MRTVYVISIQRVFDWRIGADNVKPGPGEKVSLLRLKARSHALQTPWRMARFARGRVNARKPNLYNRLR